MPEFTCKISNRKNSQAAFLVALLETPPFPDDKKINEMVRTPLRAVIAASDDDEPRTFLLLNKEQKHCIGDALLELNTPIEVWKYCELFEA